MAAPLPVLPPGKQHQPPGNAREREGLCSGRSPQRFRAGRPRAEDGRLPNALGLWAGGSLEPPWPHRSPGSCHLRPEHPSLGPPGLPVTRVSCCRPPVTHRRSGAWRTRRGGTQRGEAAGSSVGPPPAPGWDTHLEDFLYAVDGGGQQGVHLEVVVDVVRVPDAHVEDVGRETGHRARQRLGLQL